MKHGSDAPTGELNAGDDVMTQATTGPEGDGEAAMLAGIGAELSGDGDPDEGDGSGDQDSPGDDGDLDLGDEGDDDGLGEGDDAPDNGIDGDDPCEDIDALLEGN